MTTFANEIVLTVHCPWCGAVAGDPCRTPTGKPLNCSRFWTNDKSRYTRDLGFHALREELIPHIERLRFRDRVESDAGFPFEQRVASRVAL